MVSFEWFVQEVNGPRPEEQRLGQWAFNTLNRIRPDLADRVRGKRDVDPFYDDRKLRNFYELVAREW